MQLNGGQLDNNVRTHEKFLWEIGILEKDMERALGAVRYSHLVVEMIE